jgi:hypothetical protein
MWRDLVLATSCSLLLGPSLVGAAEEPRLSLRVSEVAQQGRSTLTTLTIDRGNPRTIVLISEPSHTVVAVISDNSDGALISDREWFKTDIEPHLALAEPAWMQLPLRAGAAARVQTLPRPVADQRIKLWIELPEERSPRQVELQVPLGFEAGIELRASTYTVTCGNHGGSCYDSIDCAVKGGSTTGTCCLKTTQDCGICRKSEAFCGLWLCPACRN